MSIPHVRTPMEFSSYSMLMSSLYTDIYSVATENGIFTLIEYNQVTYSYHVCDDMLVLYILINLSSTVALSATLLAFF